MQPEALARDEEPAGQVEHAAAPAGANLPAVQAVQVDEPASAAVPAAQGTHVAAEVAEVAEEAVPAPQGVQLAAPWFDHPPAMQAVHVDAPAPAEEPAAQIEQPAALVVPLPVTVPA